MAVLSNTMLTTGAVGNREELSSVVNRIAPEDTPLYTAMGKGTTESVHPEWMVDDLMAPAENIHAEGEEYTFGAIVPPVRMGDWTQILRKDWIISNTQEEVSEAGEVQKRKKTKLKRGIEIRKDVELAILTNNASVGGNIRELGGIPTWVVTNVSRGATGANGGYNSGTGLTVAATDGTQRAMTQALINTVAQSGYIQGASFNVLSVAPYLKDVFVTFMSNANVAVFRHAVTSGKDNRIISNADIYEGPFGMLTVKPNRVQAANVSVARNAIFMDNDYATFLWLRKIHEDKDIAKTGDARKGVLIGEGTLKIHNEKGLGIIADLFGTTAST